MALEPNISIERQPAIAPITEAAIARLVDHFYAKVRADAELGPIFEHAIGDDWDAHLATMCDFWSAIMLTSGRYHGNPVLVHRQIDGLRPQLFSRWLELFAETSADLFDESTARAFQNKAVRIAESLKIALFYRPDRPWPRSAP
jgi:hemoglobin